MVHSQESWLNSLDDQELAALVIELQERAEQFSPETRLRVNDELRRRKMPTIGTGRSRM